MFTRGVAGDKTGKGRWPQNTRNLEISPRIRNQACRKWVPARDFQQVEDMSRFVSWKDFFGSKMRLSVGMKDQNQVQTPLRGVESLSQAGTVGREWVKEIPVGGK